MTSQRTKEGGTGIYIRGFPGIMREAQLGIQLPQPLQWKQDQFSIMEVISPTTGHSGSCGCTNWCSLKQQCWLVCLLAGVRRWLFSQSCLLCHSADHAKTKNTISSCLFSCNNASMLMKKIQHHDMVIWHSRCHGPQYFFSIVKTGGWKKYFIILFTAQLIIKVTMKNCKNILF